MWVGKEIDMNLKEYFENTKGIGVIATAGGDGRVRAVAVPDVG